MKVAGYVRVSTEQQLEDGSHENQRQRLERWADRNGHDIELFEDVSISGGAEEREAYARLLERVEEFDAVVVRELSRFGRSLQRVLYDIEGLHERGVDFISLEENIDLTTARGELFLDVVGALNQFWADLARERAYETVQRRRRQGKHVGRPRKVDDDQLEDVREWREKGLSYGEIRTLLREVHGVDVDRSTVYRYCNA
ncbi:recombinase family protein [Halegenticoccus soli]|uniref:recombinase family protein n=1 Tax=Halegenticoccus soli TaxID=1985678 RepID=UPI000C6E70E0|nr:recombinase family protein [Halegenticoccus soli]